MPKRSRPKASTSASKKAPKKARPQIVVNITNLTNLNNYFASAPAPAPEDATATEQPTERLFATNDDRRKRVSVKKHGKPCSVYVWYSASDGTLKGGCHGTCKNQFVDLDNFAPADGSSHTQGNRTKFDAAYTAYKAAHAAGDHDECVAQRTVLEKLRTTICFECRPDPGYLSPAAEGVQGVVRRRAQGRGRDRAEQWVRAPGLPRARSGRLVHPHRRARDQPQEEGRRQSPGRPEHLHVVGVPRRRAGDGGGGQADREVDVQMLRSARPLVQLGQPARRPGGHARWQAQRHEGRGRGVQARSAGAVRVHPKQRYVDECKWDDGKGECADCARPVVEGNNEVMFEWNHLDEATKCKGGLFGKHGGVAGLVAIPSNAATLAKVKHLLDAEMKKCNLLCSNCHHRHTRKYPPSTTVF